MISAIRKSLAALFVMVVSVAGASAQSYTKVDALEVEFPSKLVYTESKAVNVRTGPGVKFEKYYQYGEPMTVGSGTLYPLLGEQNGWCKIQFGYDEVWVSKSLMKESALTPIDFSAVSNRKIDMTSAGWAAGSWLVLAKSETLPGTVVWLENNVGGESYTLTLGKVNAQGTIVMGAVSRNVNKLKYVPRAKFYVKPSPDGECLDGVDITFGDEFAVDCGGEKIVNFAKVPLASLRIVFENDYQFGSDEFITSDILRVK